jgi:hypothetical protein
VHDAKPLSSWQNIFKNLKILSFSDYLTPFHALFLLKANLIRKRRSRSYDVYVSYGYSGYPWVKEILLTTLERKWNLKICLEDRDFASQAGQSNYDLIANAINNSRHIIFVVTSDFMSKIKLP